MRHGNLILLSVLVLASSCSTQIQPATTLKLKEVQQRVAQLKPGMSMGEVEAIIQPELPNMPGFWLSGILGQNYHYEPDIDLIVEYGHVGNDYSFNRTNSCYPFDPHPLPDPNAKLWRAPDGASVLIHHWIGTKWVEVKFADLK